jgi:hypothetical protein
MMRYLCETTSFVIGQLLIKRYSMVSDKKAEPLADPAFTENELGNLS